MSHGGAERKSRKLKAVCPHALLHIVSQLLAALRAMKKFHAQLLAALRAMKKFHAQLLAASGCLNFLRAHFVSQLLAVSHVTNWARSAGVHTHACLPALRVTASMSHAGAERKSRNLKAIHTDCHMQARSARAENWKLQLHTRCHMQARSAGAEI